MNVVEESETVTGTEVVNVVSVVEVRYSEREVALAEIGEVEDVRAEESTVTGDDDDEGGKGVAEERWDIVELVREDGSEPVGRKVDPPLVVHHRLYCKESEGMGRVVS